MRGRPPLTSRTLDSLDRLRQDPGSRTLGELIQEWQWAVGEIERLRTLLGADKVPLMSPSSKTRHAPDWVTSTDPPKRYPEYMRNKDACKQFEFCLSMLYLYVKQRGFPSLAKVGVGALRRRYADIVDLICSYYGFAYSLGVTK